METYLIDGMRFEGLNENSEGWFGGPADKLLMVDSIKLIKGYIWRSYTKGYFKDTRLWWVVHEYEGER